ncbi:hypothetical protein [Aquimarina aquimarini]|uniref:hypothetical protein n=1 Tax=Aquimarina aquimarini TaxID=1191734 RepID=UPI001F2A8330|nr:hypothetical protein [Aquimarina aquimarini]
MSVRNWHIGLLIFTLFSCDSFVLKKENKEDMVKEGLEKLNWNEVDQPPLFDACKSKPEELLKQCFQNTITQHINSYLTKQTFKVKKTINDTIWVPLLITKEGEIILEDFAPPYEIAIQIPTLKINLEKSINSLPEVKPAHTRSTPVTSRYKLPLVIHLN